MWLVCQEYCPLDECNCMYWSNGHHDTLGKSMKLHEYRHKHDKITWILSINNCQNDFTWLHDEICTIYDEIVQYIIVIDLLPVSVTIQILMTTNTRGQKYKN